MFSTMWCRTFKVCRAFRELDDFSDEECDRFIAGAFEQSGTTIGWAMVFSFIVTMTLYGHVMYFLAEPISSTAAMVLGRSPLTTDGVMISILLFSVVPSYLVCTKVRNIILRTAIRERLRVTRCTACLYSILGLQARDGLVTCPECGHELRLADIGLRDADLIPKTHPATRM